MKDALKEGIYRLKLKNVMTPAVEVGAIICHIIKRDKSFLYAHGEYELSKDEYDLFQKYIAERESGIPLQYITGVCEFMSLPFTVNSHVLIPRQDTEVLVEKVIEHAKTIKAPDIKILDIGTGSGCISISLAYYIKNSAVTAVDISEKALEVAAKNAENNGVSWKISFLKGDLFEPVYNLINNLKDENLNVKSIVKNKAENLRSESENVPNIKGKGLEYFDIIVSNPPYIPTEEIKTLQREVKDHEPHLALDGGKDGLYFYRRIINEAHMYLKAGGLLSFEVGYGQTDDVAALMEKHYENISITRDYSGIERVVSGMAKGSI